jgi:hypothetical protein
MESAINAVQSQLLVQIHIFDIHDTFLTLKILLQKKLIQIPTNADITQAPTNAEYTLSSDNDDMQSQRI